MTELVSKGHVGNRVLGGQRRGGNAIRRERFRRWAVSRSLATISAEEAVKPSKAVICRWYYHTAVFCVLAVGWFSISSAVNNYFIVAEAVKK